MENKYKIFSLKRLYLLMKRQIVGNLNGLLIAFASIAGALLVISLLAGNSNPASLPGLTPLYYVMLFIGGYVFTSNIFAELHSPQRSIPFLTLPVSNLERLTNAWLLTAIIYPILALIAISLIILIAHLILGIPLDGSALSTIWPVNGLKLVWIYIITQSVFLFGAVYFRKHNFLKTLLGLFVVSNVIGLINMVVLYLLFGTVNFGEGIFIDGNISIDPETTILKYLPEVARFGFNFLILPFFLVLTWFGIKERQV